MGVQAGDSGGKFIARVCRLAGLAALFLLALPATGQAQLTRIQGQGQVNLTADQVTFDETTSSYMAQGEVQVTYGSNKLRADKLRLFSKTSVAEAEGKVRLTTPDQVLEAGRLVVNLEDNTGKVYQGTIFIRTNHFYLRGQEIEKTGPDTYQMNKGTFTSCDGSDPSWLVSGDDVDITVEGYGTAKNSTFKMMGVPVFWTPYLIFPVKSKRQSGLLIPTLGYSERDGFMISLPYFQTLGESMDATLTLNWMTARGLDIGLEYRYAITQLSKGVIMFDYLPHDAKGEDLFEKGINAEDYDSRHWFRMKADQEIGAMMLKADIDLVSDQDYLREFTFGHSGFEESDRRFSRTFGRNLDPNTSLIRSSQINLSRQWATWSFNSSLRYYDNTTTNNDTTRQELPRISLDALRQELGETGLFFQMATNYVYYHREESSTGHILDVQPKLSYPFNLGQYLEVVPSFTWSERLYSVTKDTSEETAGEDVKTSGTSELWRFDLENSSYLYRIYDLGSADNVLMVKHAIRPFIDYTFQPKLTESDVASLARRTSSRVNQISYGLKNTLTVKTQGKSKPGQEPNYIYRDFLSLDLSHSYDLEEAQRDTSDPDSPGRRPWGNINARLELDPSEHIYLQADTSYDPYDNLFDSINSLMRLADSRGDSLMAEYRYTRDGVQQIYGQLKVALTSQWSVIYINRSDLDQSSYFENTVGVAYMGQCWGFRLYYSDTQRDQGIFFGLTLLGLGEVLGVGSASPEATILTTRGRSY